MGVSFRTRRAWRRRAAVTLLLGTASLAGANPEREALDAWRNVADDDRRLKCYDDIPLQPPVATPSAVAETVAAPPSPAVPDARPARFVKLARDNHGLTLEDGQVWREIEVKRRARYRVGDAVVIARGALGSYNLSSERTGHRVKVRRIR